jgi:uncharacterized protein YndB with AHSA1/START domain
VTPLSSTIEVDRPAADVFAYATDPSRFHEWQKGVVGGEMKGADPTTVGSRCITTRRIGFAERPNTSEVIDMNPPRSWAVHGVDGPIRATVNVTVEPLDGDSRSRLTIDLDFEGHGIGKLLVPLVVRREAEKEMPGNLQRLKEQLEARPGSERPENA